MLGDDDDDEAQIQAPAKGRRRSAELDDPAASDDDNEAASDEDSEADPQVSYQASSVCTLLSCELVSVLTADGTRVVMLCICCHFAGSIVVTI